MVLHKIKLLNMEQDSKSLPIFYYFSNEVQKTYEVD